MHWRELFTPVKGIEPDEAKAFIAQRNEGDYTLLDVRQPSEYEKERIPGSLLIPVPQLGDRLGELNREKPIIVY